MQIAAIAAMPVEKHTRGDAFLHRGDLRFERRGRRIALPAVDEAGLPALEHGGELARVAIAVGDRQVQRLVQRAVLDRGAAVAVQDRGGEAAGDSRSLMLVAQTKNPSSREAGRVSCAPPGIPGLELSSL